MKTDSSLSKRVNILRWIARIFGTILVIFVSMLFFPAFIEKGGQMNVDHPGHYFMFICFGIAQIGILLGWRWEKLGGLLTVIGVIITILLNVFWVQGPRMAQTIIAFFLWLIPGFLFLYCWRKSKWN